MFNIGDVVKLPDIHDLRRFIVREVLAVGIHSNWNENSTIRVDQLEGPEGPAAVMTGFYPAHFFELVEAVRIKRKPRPLPDWF